MERPPFHPAAKVFVARSLDRYFGGAGKWHDKFTHNDSHHDTLGRYTEQSKVIRRHKNEDVQRLPDAYYGA